MKVFSISIEIKNKGGFILVNYVKFMRGPLSAYQELVRTNGTNADTIYFVTDSANNKTLLYLGQSLISDSSDTLSPAARDFLDSLPANENQINDGDIQVYVIEEVEKEVTDPETGETTTIVEEEGHWVTKGIDEVLPLNDIAEDLSPLILQRILGDNEENISDSYDTIKEISDWILNHPSSALEINERLTALEEAVGAGKTEEVELPAVDDQNNPIYEQLVDENTGNPQYLDIDPENTNTTVLSGLEEGKPVYPVYEENQNGDEPPYVPVVDPNTGEQLYWDLDEEPTLTDDSEGNPPAFVQGTETVEVEVPNDVEILKAVVGNLNTLYPQIQQAQIGTLDDRINALDSRFQAIETVLIGQDDQGIQIVPVGSLEALNENLHTYDQNDNDTSSLVKAINMLDERMQWQNIP